MHITFSKNFKTVALKLLLLAASAGIPGAISYVLGHPPFGPAATGSVVMALRLIDKLAVAQRSKPTPASTEQPVG